MDLNKLLEYSNDKVIGNFSDKLLIDRVTSTEIFKDMLRWLYLNDLNIKTRKRINLYIDSDLFIIDEMWHMFILHTKDYHDFCMQYFGRFIHHNPTSIETKKEQREAFKFKACREQIREEKKAIYSFVYDELGKEVLLRWYKEYPKIFKV